MGFLMMTEWGGCPAPFFMTITKAVGKSGSFGVDCHYDIWHIQVKGGPIFMPLGI
jgi:hypothetical protein